VSLFVLSPEIEDRDEAEVATGRSTKRPSTLYDISVLFVYFFLFITFHSICLIFLEHAEHYAKFINRFA
jgi:hypothetical protein